MSLYFITGNRNKFLEVKSLLPEIEQLDIDLPEIQELDPKIIIKTKLKEALAHHPGEFIVEDTSLYLDCLNDLPGPLIKWFLQTLGTRGLWELTKKFNNFQAEAKTIIGYANTKNDIHFFAGSVCGTIVEPKTTSSFGWDPIFRPHGASRVFAAMTKEEKNGLSMRGKTVEKLKNFLKNMRAP